MGHQFEKNMKEMAALGTVYAIADAESNTGALSSGIYADVEEAVAPYDEAERNQPEQIRTTRASTTPGSNSYLQGTTGSSIELKFLGNDAFEMLEYTGDVTVTAYFGCASIQSAPKAGAQRKC